MNSTILIICISFGTLSGILFLFLSLFTFVKFTFKPFGYFLALNLLIITTLHSWSFILLYKESSLLSYNKDKDKLIGFFYLFSSFSQEIWVYIMVFNLYNSICNKIEVKVKFKYILLMMGICYIIPVIYALISFKYESEGQKINPLSRWLNQDFSDENYLISIFELTLYLIRTFFGIASSIFIVKTTKCLLLEYKTLKKYYLDRNFSLCKYIVTAIGYPLVNFLSYVISVLVSCLECICGEECSRGIFRLSIVVTFLGSFQGILFAICFCINTDTHKILLKIMPCSCCKKLSAHIPNAKPNLVNDSEDENDEPFSESSFKNSMYT